MIKLDKFCDFHEGLGKYDLFVKSGFSHEDAVFLIHNYVLEKAQEINDLEAGLNFLLALLTKENSTSCPCGKNCTA